MGQDKRDQIRKLRDDASSLVSKGKHSKAADIYLQLVSLDSSEGDHARRAADCYRTLGKQAEQMEMLLSAARAYGDSQQALKGVAMCKLANALSPGHPEVEAVMNALSRTREQHHRDKVDRTIAERQTQTRRSTLNQEVRTHTVRESHRPSPPEGEEAELPQAGSLVDLELTTRLRQDSSKSEENHTPSAAPAEEVIEIDDILIEELAPASAHIDLEHLGNPEAPAPAQNDAADALARTPLFQDLSPELLAKLLDRVELVELAAGRSLFAQGDPADAMYVVADGSVSAVGQSSPDEEPFIIAKLTTGEFFGEIGLLSDQPRQASIVAETDCQLLRFGRDAIRELVDETPQFLRALLKFLRERLVHGIMLTSPLFTPFGPEDQATLKRLFRFVEAGEDMPLINEGEKADGLYVLLVGEAVAEQATATGTRQLGVLRSGDVFGEMSLLKNQPAMATVTTTTRCFALKLPARYFMQVLMSHPVMLEYVATLGAQRDGDNAELLANEVQRQRGSESLSAEDEHIPLL